MSDAKIYEVMCERCGSAIVVRAEDAEQVHAGNATCRNCGRIVEASSLPVDDTERVTVGTKLLDFVVILSLAIVVMMLIYQIDPGRAMLEPLAVVAIYLVTNFIRNRLQRPR